MPRMTFLQAVGQAIQSEMRADPRVFVMGEDVQSGIYGDFGVQEFGPDRVRNTPISEAAIVGAGIGAALTGMRPVVEATVCTFLYCAMDQIVNQAAKMRYMFGGQARLPLVIRSQVLYGVSAAAHHSDRPWGMFAHCPGLKIVVPSTAAEAGGLMIAAIRDDNPVLWFEDSSLWGRREVVPDEVRPIPLGTAMIKRAGTDVTVTALAGAVHLSLKAAQSLEAEGISVEVIDLRSVVPLDRGTILNSVAKTGRLIAVDLAPVTCSVASEIAAIVAEEAFDRLKGPVVRIAAPDIPAPYTAALEHLMYPTAEAIAAAARQLVGRDERVSHVR